LSSNKHLENILKNKILPSEISDKDLVNLCEFLNKEYRSGSPKVSDEDYDFLYLKELRSRFPSHKFLKHLEPEIEGFQKRN